MYITFTSTKILLVIGVILTVTKSADALSQNGINVCSSEER
jgi:hypothetical protein